MKDENPMKNIGFYGKSGNKGGYTMTEGEIEEVVRTKNLSVMQLFRLYYSTEPGKGHGKKKKKNICEIPQNICEMRDRDIVLPGQLEILTSTMEHEWGHLIDFYFELGLKHRQT